ncbi:hypothetical protein EI533_11625 [Pseudomonas donghuensis]|nr:hypothetical protein [Pseudomonas donghuensis]
MYPSFIRPCGPCCWPVGGIFKDHRPRPSRPRMVKRSKTRFPVDRKAAPLEGTALRPVPGSSSPKPGSALANSPADWPLP